jgi:DNA-directed RNA polymerase II subunit RPB2
MEEMQFEVTKKFLSSEGIISHHLNSYNLFVNFLIQKIFDEIPPITIKDGNSEYTTTFGQVYIDKPFIVEEDRTIRHLTPYEARMREMFYEAQVSCDIIESYYENDIVKEEKINRKQHICRIPVMVGSSLCNLYGLSREEWIQAGECEYDMGGYFIVRGKERVLIPQERINYNSVYTFKQPSHNKWVYISEVRSMSDETGHSVLVQAKIDSTGKQIMFSLPYIGEEVPAGYVLKAIGCTKEEMKAYLNFDEEETPFFNTIVRASSRLKTQEECLEYIGEKSIHIIPKERRQTYAEQVLDNELFPHLGVSSRATRSKMLCYMLRRLVYTFVGKRTEDDRDNISLKRIDTSGGLIADLFRMLLKKMIENTKKYLVKRTDIITILNRCNSITSGLHHAFSTGNWGIQKNAYIKTGVSQVLSRLCFSSFLSHLRRLVIPIGKEGKNTKIRQLHPTHCMMVCPAETPEGHSVGIVKNLAMLTKISSGTNPVLLRDILKKHVSDIGKNIVFVNGWLLGYVDDVVSFINTFREYRSVGLIDKETSIGFDDIDKEINIFCDEGRLIRPVFTVDKNKLLIEGVDISKMSWDELEKKNYITYLDNNEIETSVLAMTAEEVHEEQYDYCEIHPSNMFGICASIIPFPDHSQAPRNCYSSSMSKQALSAFAMNYQMRTDTFAHVMGYPQKPLVKTRHGEYLGFDALPSGANAIVAVACYSGYNQEDSILLNKAAIDRGMFVTTSYRTVICEEKKKSPTNYETIRIPPSEVQTNGNYSKLGNDGLVEEGAVVGENDVLIGKVYTKIGKDGEEEMSDCSITAKKGEEGIVDKVYITTSADGFRIVRIRIRNRRIPEIGDKFCNRSGQKGTVGMIFNEEDMPFTETGIRPDIIINAHAFPSRMTINYLIETILGKTCALEGSFGYSTSFTSESDNPVDVISERLSKFGFEKYGNDVLYSGFTGEPLKAKIFMGVTYYQRLKHMVGDKMHARSYGNITMLARQPVEGRSRDGGLRLGEMERDSLLAHGTSAFLKERLFNMSDAYKVTLCKACGCIISKEGECQMCANDAIVDVNMPYACKLLFQELNAMGIKTAITTK